MCFVTLYGMSFNFSISQHMYTFLTAVADLGWFPGADPGFVNGEFVSNYARGKFLGGHAYF